MGQCLEPRGGCAAAGGGQAVPAGPGQAQRHLLPQPAVPQGHHGQLKSIYVLYPHLLMISLPSSVSSTTCVGPSSGRTRGPGGRGTPSAAR